MHGEQDRIVPREHADVMVAKMPHAEYIVVENSGHMLPLEHPEIVNTEIVALADYRLHYAAYRSDPDLQRLHQLFPMIAQWDDHEFANDVWKGGAENHNDGEGDWRVREAAAERAHGEWMPLADTRWRHYQAGDLATIFLPETRITARDKQFEIGDILADKGDAAAALEKAAAYVRGMVGLEPECATRIGVLADELDQWLVVRGHECLAVPYGRRRSAHGVVGPACSHVVRQL